MSNETPAPRPDTPESGKGSAPCPEPTAANSPAYDSSIWSRAYRGLTLGLTLTNVGTAFEALAVATAMPAVSRDLHGLPLYGWVFSAYMLSNLVGITVGGGEADRRGLLRPFAIGVGLFVLGLLSAGGAPTMVALVLGRTVQGFGGGILAAVSYTAIGRIYPEACKPKMLAAMSTSWVLPGLIGPALAGWIADHLGWRFVFLGLAPLVPIAAALAVPALRRIPPGAADTPTDPKRLLDALTLALGMGLMLFGLSLKSLLPALLLLLPGGLAALFAMRRLLPPGTLLAKPGIPAAVATMGLLNLTYFGFEAFLPLTLTDLRGTTSTFAGLILTAATITWTTGVYVQARLVPRGYRRVLVIVGLLIIFIGMLGASGALFPAFPILLVPTLWGVTGLGMGLATSTSMLVVLENAPPGQEGATSASMQTADVIGVALGTGLGGFLVGLATTNGGSPRPGILLTDAVMLALTLVAVLAAARLPSRRH